MREASGFTHIGALARPFIEYMKRRTEEMEQGKVTAETEEPGRPGKPPLPEENEARVVGRVVNAPRLRTGTGEGGDFTLARLMLAVNRTYRDSSHKQVRETAFIPVVAWGDRAKECGAVGKGTALRVVGRIKTWEAEGTKYRWELQATKVDILDLRRPAADAAEEPQEELLPS